MLDPLWDFLIKISLADILLWTIRRSERDVVPLYESLSPVMCLATGRKMLNFGYWTDDVPEPGSAQESLCRKFAELAELGLAKTAVDVGSGLAAPAMLWQQTFEDLRLYCVNTSYSQLRSSGQQDKIVPVNATSIRLPFADCSADRVLALESSQHFRPYGDFLSESKRILSPSGMLVLALPVAMVRPSLLNLGMLKFTWLSEHYALDNIRSWIDSAGFKVSKEQLIGSSVYGPLADYYICNRQSLRAAILERYPAYVETILYRSIRAMKKASQGGVIDYVLLKCVLR